MYFLITGRPMINPPTQMMTTKEGDSLDVTVEFCAKPIFTKVLWISDERVYIPGGEFKDGVKALPIQVKYVFFNSYFMSIIDCKRCSYDIKARKVLKLYGFRFSQSKLQSIHSLFF